MLKRNLVLRLVSALAAVSAIGLLPAAASYAAVPSAAITKPAAGMAGVVLINQDTGKNETLTVTFNGTPYTIAPQGSSSSQVEFSLAPGSYDFTASVPGIASISHSIYVAADKVTSLSFRDNAADLQNNDQDADDTAQTQQVVSVVGNESDEHETKTGTNKDEAKDSGPDGDEVHLQLGPSTVQDNDDILVTVGDMTAMAQ
jgi:hypothetical protein